MAAPSRETILVLTAGFGEGHNTAAKNIASALKQESGGSVEPLVLDPFTAAAPNLSAFMKWGYRTMTNRMPGLWNWLYQSTQQGNFGNHVWDRFVGLMHWLEEKFAETKPHTVVMTYPLYAAFIPRFNPAVPRPKRVYVAVTDSITIHPIWTQAPAHRWFVTDDHSLEVARRQGLAAERCSVTGFATSLQFAATPPQRERRGVLYFATTSNSHVKQTLTGLLRDLPPEVPLTIVTGRSEDRLRSLIARLLHASRRENVELHGWCGTVPDLMSRHALCLTKAGGATVHECFAAGIPAVINYVIPGQEEGNAMLMERTGCGCRSEEPAQSGALIREILTGDALARMTASMHTHRCPNGAVEMARAILAGA